MICHAFFVIFEKTAKLKLSSAANYWWCFMVNLFVVDLSEVL